MIARGFEPPVYKSDIYPTVELGAAPDASVEARRSGRSAQLGIMAKKLKVFQTSLGFYDQAIAAPSMKAALEAWGAKSNLFHQGIAKESDDPDVIAAAMSNPGVILRRPVGSDGLFREHADLPANLSDREFKPGRSRPNAKKRSAGPMDGKATRKAALAFEKEERRRERARRNEEAAQEKERERRRQAIAEAQAALEKAERAHERRAATIDAERASLEKRSQSEDRRWESEKKKSEGALRRARE